MKRFIGLVLAVLMLGLAAPKQSEANGAWVPAALIGGIILGAAISEAAHSHPVYVYDAPCSGYAYRPPRPVYLHTHHMNRFYYRHGNWGTHGHWGDRGRSLPPQHRWDRPHR
jgi:hypothetical protein